MDDIVKAALAKWPNVPDCYGWLGLDARGNWYLRDDQAQAAGGFCAANMASERRLAAKGSLLRHDKLIDFIQRNYASDASGQWFFQNGPQRVYVELEATPFIWRIGSGFAVTAHTGSDALVQRCMVDEDGRVYLETDLGFGLVHTLDMLIAADAIEQGLWVPQSCAVADIARKYDYVASPQTLQK